MPEQAKKEKSRSKEFLDKFTEETIMQTKNRQDEEEKNRKEEARRKRSVEIEKLKEKFAKEDVEKIQPAKEVQPLPTKPVLAPKPIAMPSKPAEKPMPAVKPAALPPPKPEEKSAAPIKPPAPIPKKELPVTPVQIPPRLPPLAPGEIDFEKIIFLVRDPLVTYIECPGENKNIIIRRAGATAKTQITLKKDEITNIIKSFSEKARIPLVEGMLTARIGSLEISAVISETASPSFILRRIVAQVMPSEPSRLEAPMMKFPGPGLPAIPASKPPMPPVARPFTPSGMPPANPPQPKPAEKESFFNKKFKIGK